MEFQDVPNFAPHLILGIRLAQEGEGRPVGRISAQIDRLYLDKYQNATGHFGMLDAEDDPAIFCALLATAEGWLRARGMARALGPFNLSINEECGLLVNGLPYLLPRWLARRTARKETDYATTRLLASIVALPLFWALEVWIVWRLAGAGWALLFALSLPVSGLLAYRYLRGVGRLRSQLRFGWLALTRRHTAARLLAERQALVSALERAKDDYLTATHGSSF